MQDMLVPIFGENGAIIFQYVITLAVILGLIGLIVWAIRRYGRGSVGPSARGRLPRLAVVDTLAIDGKRRLVLVRRDNVEHLVLIGGPTDVVVEPSIVRQRVAQRPGQPTPGGRPTQIPTAAPQPPPPPPAAPTQSTVQAAPRVLPTRTPSPSPPRSRKPSPSLPGGARSGRRNDPSRRHAVNRHGRPWPLRLWPRPNRSREPVVARRPAVGRRWRKWNRKRSSRMRNPGDSLPLPDPPEANRRTSPYPAIRPAGKMIKTPRAASLPSPAADFRPAAAPEPADETSARDSFDAASAPPTAAADPPGRRGEPRRGERTRKGNGAAPRRDFDQPARVKAAAAAAPS